MEAKTLQYMVSLGCVFTANGDAAHTIDHPTVINEINNSIKENGFVELVKGTAEYNDVFEKLDLDNVIENRIFVSGDYIFSTDLNHVYMLFLEDGANEPADLGYYCITEGEAIRKAIKYAKDKGLVGVDTSDAIINSSKTAVISVYTDGEFATFDTDGNTYFVEPVFESELFFV